MDGNRRRKIKLPTGMHFSVNDDDDDYDYADFY